MSYLFKFILFFIILSFEYFLSIYFYKELPSSNVLDFMDTSYNAIWLLSQLSIFTLTIFYIAIFIITASFIISYFSDLDVKYKYEKYIDFLITSIPSFFTMIIVIFIATTFNNSTIPLKAYSHVYSLSDRCNDIESDLNKLRTHEITLSDVKYLVDKCEKSIAFQNVDNNNTKEEK